MRDWVNVPDTEKLAAETANGCRWCEVQEALIWADRMRRGDRELEMLAGNRPHYVGSWSAMVEIGRRETMRGEGA